MKSSPQDSADDNEMIPFNVADYIDNPIKAMRVKANLTQVQLAELMDVSQAYIGKIERANHSPTDNLLSRVEQAIHTHQKG